MDELSIGIETPHELDCSCGSAILPCGRVLTLLQMSAQLCAKQNDNEKKTKLARTIPNKISTKKKRKLPFIT